MKPEDNLLIFQFHRGLIPQYSSYFELYNQTYNTYKDDGTRTTKYTLFRLYYHPISKHDE